MEPDFNMNKWRAKNPVPQQKASLKYNKNDIDNKIDTLIAASFAAFDKNPEDGRLTEKEVRAALKSLMHENKEDLAWDDEEFDSMYQKFEDDEKTEGKEEEDGMDSGELSNFIRYICSL